MEQSIRLILRWLIRRKGIQFYTSLNGLLDPALEKVNKFIVDRRAEGAAIFKSIQVEKPKRDQDRLREDLSRLNLNYGTKPPPPLPPQTTRTPSMPLAGGYTYSSPQPQPTYSYPSPPPPPPRPQQPQSPQVYAPPQSQYGYHRPSPQQHSPYGPSPPPQPQYGVPPALQPKPGQTGYRSPPPPPPPPPPPAGQGNYGYRPPY